MSAHISEILPATALFIYQSPLTSSAPVVKVIDNSVQSLVPVNLTLSWLVPEPPSTLN